MAQRPGIWGRLLARIEGEVPADTLEAYRRAGGAVHALLDQVEERRLDLKVRGVDPWATEPATQAELLCAWNAFALQTLGDQFLDADYRASPTTVGYVPPVTSEQILAFYGQVEPWLTRAREAGSNPDFRLDVAVPMDLPPWAAVEPCPTEHLEAIRAAVASLRLHASAALAVFPTTDLSPDRQHAMDRVRQLLAEAESKCAYAEGLCAGPMPPSVHEDAERHLKDAAERYYHLGQLLAMPGLIGAYGRRRPEGAATTAMVARRPLPGEPGFDPWCLTDPASRPSWERDPAARDAIMQLWRNDPNPRQTLAIQSQIDAALARGDVEYATARGVRLGSYFCCPWSAVYVAKRPVTLGERKLRPLQQFTFDVSAEGIPEGEPFRREIFVGSFTPTDRVDYCNPSERGQGDE